MLRTRIVFIAPALAVLAGPLPAQELAGELVDRSGAPIRAARVVLQDSAGTRLASGLTDAAGAFRLRAPSDGRYRVRADRVGYAGTTSPWLALRAGEVTPLRLVANPNAITLEGITARAGARCGSGTPATALLWEEARKALAAAEEAVQARAVRYQFVSYRRELDPGSLSVRSESRHTAAAFVGTPFASTPLDTLLERGFVRAYGDSVSWDAPDGPVLLAQRFVDTHCFQVASHPDSARLVGLAFRPAGGRRIPDVAGTLWLERATARLRYLEYRYVNVGQPGRNPQVGGRVEFELLSTGHWMVRRWRIRMPTAGPEDVFPGVQAVPLSAYRRGPLVRSLVEVGGEVTAAGDQLLASAEARARVGGMVWDSLRGRPLPGALVSVIGTVWTAAADSAGAFVLGPLPPGEYSIAFSHPVLTALGTPAEVQSVALPQDSARMLRLSLPAEERVVASRCGALPQDRSVLLGRVASDGAPVGGAEVSVAWNGLTRDRTAVDQQRVRTVSGEDGTFLLCDVPGEMTLQVSVRWEGRTHRATLTPVATRVLLHMVEL